VTILGHRLYGTVALLGPTRILVMAMAMTRSLVGDLMIVPVGVFVLNGKWGLLKKMMDAMGCGHRDKKHKKGNDPQGADGAETTKCCSHRVDKLPLPIAA
jgi:hypothetical protein